MRIFVVKEGATRIPVEIIPTDPLLAQLRTAPDCQNCEFFSVGTNFLREEASAASLDIHEGYLFDALSLCIPSEDVLEEIERCGFDIGFRFADVGKLAISIPITRK